MSLSRFKVGAAVAVSDMERAREFYEGLLGLVPATDHEPEDNRAYRCKDDSIIHVFRSPYAGHARATLAGWYVEGQDIEGLVDSLAARGVVFERYDEEGLVTDARGIAHFEGDAKVAYFKDPDGNVLSIAQAGRET